MANEKDSLLDRMKQLPLWQWGSLLIFGGVFSNLAAGLLIDAGDMSRSEQRATQLGAALGGGLVVVAGIVLILWHFVRARKR